MSTSFSIPLVVLSRLAGAIGLHLPAGSPGQAQDSPKFAKNESSFVAEFDQWRFDDSTDGTHYKKLQWTAPLWTAPPEILRRCAESVLTGMPENNVDQRGTGDFFFTDERLTDFLDTADHVYVICMSCTRDFPTKLKHKVSILNGRLSDECFAQHFRYDASDPDHHRRVTLAHRLAIADAQANNFNIALVLEEDVIFKEDMEIFDFESLATLIHDASREWEVLRLTWFDYNSAISSSCTSENVRKCNEWVEQNTCTIPSCDLHSSGAYMIPAKSYERFLTEGAGAIDGAVLNQFKQTVVTPALCNQCSYMTRELIGEDVFINSCKGA